MVKPLLSARVLILEDDYYQAQDSKDRLEKAGAEVVTMTGAIEVASALLDTHSIDCGLLDVNLAGQMSFDLARSLTARGVPVIFLTGYEATYLPPDLAGMPIITKPIDWEVAVAMLIRLLQTSSTTRSEDDTR